MGYWRGLLALVTLAGLACAKEGTREMQQRAALPQTPYTLEINFEGLVGYFNDMNGVWALLPKAHATFLPPGVDPNDIDLYPEHYAVLKVNGANIKSFDIPADIQIPIDGYEIKLPSTFFGTGSGIPTGPFEQSPGDAAADKLDPLVLGSTPPKTLTARIELPLSSPTDWTLDTHDSNGNIPLFFRATPKPKNAAGFCKDSFASGVADKPRVEAVSWKKDGLTGDLQLTLHSLGTPGTDLPLVLTPLQGQNKISMWILNKEGASLYDDKYESGHFAPYRWYYGLSGPDCNKHYYPQAGAGGNRCPQKLYIN